MFRPRAPGFMQWHDDSIAFRGDRNRYSEAYGNYRGGYKPLRRPYGYSDIPRDEQYDFPPYDIDVQESYGPPLAKRRFESNRASANGASLLIQFGIPRGVVDKLPKQLLEMYKVDNCGLCAIPLDTTLIATTHYLSKNHNKNQKKWVTQKMDVYNSNPESMPFKDRELYCELCDVNITSTIHAKSHYAGRSHNAIVEKRKKPKNLVLLRPGMERRTNQLINREKKASRKNPEGNQEAKDKQKEKPVLTSELYCDICKTCMTCSDQMTAHLNGKKHLSKEKTHILKQMKAVAAEKDSTSKEDPKPAPETNIEEGNGKEGESSDPKDDKEIADECNWENW